MPLWRMGYLPLQGDMEQGKNPISPTFAEIKRKLDPAFSYMVFEKEEGSGEGGDFYEVIQTLSALKNRDLGRQICRDVSRGKMLLVIKMEPEEAEVVMQEIIETGFSRQINYYLYRS